MSKSSTMNMERKVILYIAMSLDGYIATKDDGLEFLSIVEEAGEDYSYNDFVNTVDSVIIGRKTYDKVLSMGYKYPHANKELFVITRKQRAAEGKVSFYSDDLKTLVTELKKRDGKNIYIDECENCCLKTIAYNNGRDVD